MVITSFRLHLYINLHLLNFPHQNGTPSYPAGKFQTRLDRMNTPNTRPITSSLALNCLTSPCKRELVALRHDALIWKTSKRLLKITTQDQAWRNSELNFGFEHLKRWLCAIWWNGHKWSKYWQKGWNTVMKKDWTCRPKICYQDTLSSTPIAAMCHTGSDAMVTELFQA